MPSLGFPLARPLGADVGEPGHYWGPHFPDAGLITSYWSTHFPDGAATIGSTPPTSPAGAGAFELALEGQATITFAWQTAIEKHLDGKEHRASNIDDPAVRYEGEAMLLGPATRSARTRLARYAALGSSFSLGLPYEAIAIRADSIVNEVAVFSDVLAIADWARPGVRVLVQHRAYGSKQAVIQDVTSDMITIEIDDGTPLGNVGKYGAFIMPMASIYLDAQQGFARYQPSEPVERWGIRARNADRGLTEAGQFAELSLTGIYSGLIIQARISGTAGNALSVYLYGGSGQVEGNLYNYPGGPQFQVMYLATTVSDFITALNSSTTVRVIGTPLTPAATISIGDVFGPTLLANGTNALPIEIGLGATITTFAGTPVWDRPLIIEETISDSIQSMAQPMDLGGLPFTVQTVTVPDWARAIGMNSITGGADWQWMKRMLWTLRGRWLSFFLPTWRADLVPLSVGVGTLTVSDGDENGDVRTWYPTHRRHVQARMANGSVVYARISLATDNGNLTTTLSLVNGLDVAVTLGSVPVAVSWLELCHLESDEVSVTIQSREFQMAIQARVVQQ